MGRKLEHSLFLYYIDGTQMLSHKIELYLYESEKEMVGLSHHNRGCEFLRPIGSDSELLAVGYPGI